MTVLWIGTGVMVLIMTVLWLWQCRTGRGSVVDVAWTFGVAGLAISQLVTVPDPVTARHGLVAILIGLWAVRLAGMLAWRIRQLPEDGRYLEMNTKWGGRAAFRMFLFHQFQALGCLLFAWPFYLVALSTGPLSAIDFMGVACWLIGIVGGTVADVQLTRFRLAGPSGRVCQVGLWRYSRHPNYFFEFVHWCSYVLLGWSAPQGAWLILLPAILLFLIFFVTGIPPTEKQALATRGEAYRAYQRTTSVFIPLPVKRDVSESLQR